MKKLAWLLCIALLCYCASAAALGAAMGRYVEEPIKLPLEGNLYFACAGGTVYYADASGDMLLSSADLTQWDVRNLSRAEEIPPVRDAVNGITVSADGAVYLSSGWAWLDEDDHPYVERIQGGRAERVQLDQRLDTGVDKLVLCALPDGELLGLSDIEAYRFSKDGETLQKYAVSGGEAMAVYENEVAICQSGDALISILDIESGKLLRSLPMPSGVAYGSSQIGYDANGALYYIDPSGLYQSNAGSSMMTRIADGRLMTVGKPSAGARALLFGQANNPVVAYSQGGGTTLIAYRYDEMAATEPSAVLSVFALYDSPTLRECANQFQLRYPDVLVDVTVALPKGTAITADDAIRTLNTEMLAGKGPDVLVLDGLPIQSYLDKGVLADLSPVVQPMIDSGALLGNIAGSLGQDGAIRAVPTRFLLPSIWGDVKGLHTLADMADWAAANPDSLPYFAADVETLIGTFYLSSAPAWFTETGRLDAAKIEGFLTALKAIRGQWTFEAVARLLGWDALGFDYGAWRARAGDWNPYPAMVEGHMWEELQGIDFFAAGAQRQLPFLLRGVDAATYPNGAMAATARGSFAPLPGQAEGCFVPKLTLGAGKASQNSDLALRFIEHALGEECQNADFMEGFPVNIKALDAAQARGKTRFGLVSVGDWVNQWLGADQQKRLRGMIEALTTPVIPDFTLFSMIVQESEPFFEGRLSAGQAAAHVCAKANAYLAE